MLLVGKELHRSGPCPENSRDTHQPGSTKRNGEAMAVVGSAILMVRIESQRDQEDMTGRPL